jgi:hypothetical protein
MVCETTAAGLGVRGVVMPCVFAMVDVNASNNAGTNLVTDIFLVISKYFKIKIPR